MFTDVKKMRTFVAIVEEGSFTGAAERLNMAQPWVSVQLKQLEDVLGLTLVERLKGKFIKLSPVGLEFFKISKKLLASCDEATEDIRALKNRDRARLVLGVDPITLYIPERNNLIMRFMAQAADADLQLVSRTPAELFEGLGSGEFDLILTSGPAPHEADVEVLPLYEYELRLFVPKAQPGGNPAPACAGLQGAQILTLPDSYHPAHFAWLKSALAAFDVRWIECPEPSYQALIHYSAMMGLPTLSPAFSELVPEIRKRMEMRTIKDVPLKVRWGLMRRPGYRRMALDNFWRMAVQSDHFTEAA